MTQNELNKIIDGVRKKESKSFEKLYNYSITQAYRSAYAILHDEQAVNDVLQEAYIKMYLKIDSLTDNNKFDQWFKKIVINMCKDYLKKKQLFLYSDYDNEDSNLDFEELIEDEKQPSLDESITNDELAKDMERCINSLPEEQRVCIVLHYYESLSVKEIAQLLEVSENTVKSRLKYGRDKLRKKVENLEEKGYKIRGIAFAPLIKATIDNESKNISPKATKLLLKAILSRTVKGSVLKIGTAFISKKVIAAVVAVTVVTGTVATVTTVYRSNIPQSEETTTVVQTTISTENQKNIDEAMKYSDDNYATNIRSAPAVQYNGYTYYIDADYVWDEDLNVKKSSIMKRNDITGEEELVLGGANANGIVVYGDYLFYSDFTDHMIYQLDLNNSDLIPISKGRVLSDSWLNDTSMYSSCDFFLKDGNIIYIHNDTDTDMQTSLFKYNIKTGETQKLYTGTPSLSYKGYYSEVQYNIDTGNYTYRFYDEFGSMIDQENVLEKKVFENDEYIIVNMGYVTDLEKTGKYDESCTYQITNKINGETKTIINNTDNISAVNGKIYYIKYDVIEQFMSAEVYTKTEEF